MVRLSGVSNTSYIKTSREDITELSNIFRNKQNIKEILNYLNKKTDVKSIIIRGSIGQGKTTLIKSCAISLGFNYIVDNNDTDNIENLLLSIKTYSNKRLIIIKNIDSYSKKNDIYKFISNSKGSINPVIFTSNDHSIGTVREVPKNILQLKFEHPYITELVRHFSNRNITKSALEKLIVDSNYDIRYIDISLNNNIKKITTSNINLGLKDIERDTFDSIRFCSNKTNKLSDRLGYASIYTNSTIFHNYPKLTQDYSKIADLCCLANEYLNYAFANQQWGLIEQSCYLIGTIETLNEIGGNNNSNNNNNNNNNKLVYPPSIINKDPIDFKLIELDGFKLMAIIPKYFNGNKFIGNKEKFQRELEYISDPIQSYKFANICEDSKKVSSFLREFKKWIK